MKNKQGKVCVCAYVCMRASVRVCKKNEITG